MGAETSSPGEPTSYENEYRATTGPDETRDVDARVANPSLYGDFAGSSALSAQQYLVLEH